MKIKIGVLSHYGDMEPEFLHLAAELGCELVFRLGVLDLAIDTAVEMEQQMGVKAIIGITKTVESIQDYVTVPTVGLFKSPYSLTLAFHEAKQLGRHLALVDPVGPEAPYDFKAIAAITGCKVRCYMLQNTSQTESLVQEIIADGCDVVVTTASCMIAKAQQRNLNWVRIKVSDLEMANAISTAISMVRIKDAEVRRAGYMRAVVAASATATFTLNDVDRVNIVNLRAQDILHISEQELVGRTLPELAAKSEVFQKVIELQDDLDMIKTRDTELVVIRKELTATDGRHIGMIYHLQDPNSVRQRELFVRKKAHEKGFVATATFGDICGVSPCIKTVIDQAKKYAATPSNILISGESGCGKEIFAQSAHNNSPYRDGPFVALNCAALPENLLESELFGYEEGSFTGAKRGGKSGLLEQAHNGTLFLDEIGEMPLALQSKLLRVLQERQLRRVGGDKIIPIDIRIISATNRNLHKAVELGLFRADLFYRINVLFLHIPPLRERREDIGPLAVYFARQIAAQSGKSFRFSSACFAEMERYDWPGNVRELNNFVERVVVLASQKVVTPELVRTALAEMAGRLISGTECPAEDNMLHIPLTTMKEMELEILRQTYLRVGGDRKKLEHLLAVSGTTLWRRLRDLYPTGKWDPASGLSD